MGDGCSWVFFLHIFTCFCWTLTSEWKSWILSPVAVFRRNLLAAQCSQGETRQGKPYHLGRVLRKVSRSCNGPYAWVGGCQEGRAGPARQKERGHRHPPILDLLSSPGPPGLLESWVWDARAVLAFAPGAFSPAALSRTHAAWTPVRVSCPQVSCVAAPRL